MSKPLLTTVLLVLAALPLSGVPARAQEVTQAMVALERAKNGHAVGDNLNALNSIREAEEALWNMAPLGVRNVAFVTEKPQKFGFYTPKAGEDFSDDEPLILYCEPIGYTQPRGADGTYSISLLSSVTILDSNGAVIGELPNMPPMSMAGHRTFVTEFMVMATIGIRGLSPGTYTLRLTLTDNLDPTKSADVEKVFNLLPGADS
ncbi:MAG: hypothetical protein LBL95_05580 [Deltaproteobacteria bacterium]|jgi:hypothetical protein|nr:hypothetical protein [Deltaproteobacteria bacterium]